MQRRRWLAASIAALVLPAARAQPAPARVAAASDLQFALPELSALFEQAGPHRVELSFGSSGNFARQIQQGAPLDLFLSADEAFVFRLADAGLTHDRGTLYAIGRIALLAPAGSTWALDDRLDGLRRGWAEVRRFAIANPEHAPYGRAAREALESLGLWAEVQPRLVLGENISQATQYVATGAAQAGITAASLALAPAVAARTRHRLLPETLHRPLRQRMVLLKDARPSAVAFHQFLTTPAARSVFARCGFAPPGGAS
ncbi:MAG TPA: molybdate ABC transporter substrate-binding protein [Albitalea sp.]|nr:molybdate ABC transporter substrate-binding protein [Albitalea sp.]